MCLIRSMGTVMHVARLSFVRHPGCGLIVIEVVVQFLKHRACATPLRNGSFLSNRTVPLNYPPCET